MAQIVEILKNLGSQKILEKLGKIVNCGFYVKN